jgi:hypothetical protein
LSGAFEGPALDNSMTRTGSLAYYAAAWVIGCFVLTGVGSLADFLHGHSFGAKEFLGSYFISLVVGAADAILFAFALRHLMHFRKTRVLVEWIAAGAIVAYLLTRLLSTAGLLFTESPILYRGSLGEFVFQAVFLAPVALWKGAAWITLISGAASAWILFLIDRAFTKDYPPHA